MNIIQLHLTKPLGLVLLHHTFTWVIFLWRIVTFTWVKFLATLPTANNITKWRTSFFLNTLASTIYVEMRPRLFFTSFNILISFSICWACCVNWRSNCITLPWSKNIIITYCKVLLSLLLLWKKCLEECFFYSNFIFIYNICNLLDYYFVLLLD